VHAENGNRGGGVVGAEASLEPWLFPTILPMITAGESKLGVTFNWSVSKLGVPGAIIVRNCLSSEFFLKTITLNNVPGTRTGTVVFVANSWVYPQAMYGNDDRVFFANDVSFDYHDIFILTTKVKINMVTD
jgi:linoleate 9S-lipoxygenase